MICTQDIRSDTHLQLNRKILQALPKRSNSKSHSTGVREKPNRAGACTL